MGYISAVPNADAMPKPAQSRALQTVGLLVVALLYACSQANQNIKLESGTTVRFVGAGYRYERSFGSSKTFSTLTIRYETTLPFQNDRLDPEVSQVWDYFQPMIRRHPWDRVVIEPMTFGFAGISWRGMPFVFDQSPEGWIRTPPRGPAFGIGTVPN